MKAEQFNVVDTPIIGKTIKYVLEQEVGGYEIIIVFTDNTAVHIESYSMDDSSIGISAVSNWLETELDPDDSEPGDFVNE